MRFKIIVSILAIATIIGYYIALRGNPLIFSIFFAIYSWSLFMIAISFIPDLIWKLSSAGIRKNYDKNKIKFRAIILSCCLIFFLLLVISLHNRNLMFSPIENIKSLPYLTWAPGEENIHYVGVTRYDKGKSYKGINIYNPANLATAYLIDMDGNILHTWSKKIKKNAWDHIKMCTNGDLLAIVKDRMLIRLGWNSRVKWTRKMRFHHDIAIAKNGDIYTLSRMDELVFYFGLPVPILSDYIVILSEDGKIKKKISLYKIFKRIPFEKLRAIYSEMLKYESIARMVNGIKKKHFIFSNSTPFDIYHANAIEIIDRDINGLCKKGDILLSFRELDLIAILNLEKEKIIWEWGRGSLNEQHHPSLLENNNILIFDNGVDREFSRIIELNTFTKKIVWEYGSRSSQRFFSLLRGACQRLPNGNTLITESDKGHVFEITKEGKVVWEFYNPQRKMDTKERATIYRFMRLTEPENYPILKDLKQ